MIWDALQRPSWRYIYILTGNEGKWWDEGLWPLVEYINIDNIIDIFYVHYIASPLKDVFLSKHLMEKDMSQYGMQCLVMIFHSWGWRHNMTGTSKCWVEMLNCEKFDHPILIPCGTMHL